MSSAESKTLKLSEIGIKIGVIAVEAVVVVGAEVITGGAEMIDEILIVVMVGVGMIVEMVIDAMETTGEILIAVVEEDLTGEVLDRDRLPRAAIQEIEARSAQGEVTHTFLEVVVEGATNAEDHPHTDHHHQYLHVPNRHPEVHHDVVEDHRQDLSPQLPADADPGPQGDTAHIEAEEIKGEEEARAVEHVVDLPASLTPHYPSLLYQSDEEHHPLLAVRHHHDEEAAEMTRDLGPDQDLFPLHDQSGDPHVMAEDCRVAGREQDQVTNVG